MRHTSWVFYMTSQSYKKNREGQEKVKREKFDNQSWWCVRKFRWQSTSTSWFIFTLMICLQKNCIAVFLRSEAWDKVLSDGWLQSCVTLYWFDFFLTFSTKTKTVISVSFFMFLFLFLFYFFVNFLSQFLAFQFIHHLWQTDIVLSRKLYSFLKRSLVF